ncbi:integrase arm-type DNA-binding domain-containing protein [Rhizorhabdus sp.]|uniref:tyrosine-type recombinase/integrase n=1 Tax=Rhizorhabdus sp. TaxID=1968843 RepID=UPI0019B121D3|nr:integrase arm-type DNA-binding domain-containing protein [Rhizorhabdus sp.]MBD3761404.1 integrase arm-type DNA-binding domain-containing protein [Rhizorhabdus sp.]
MPLTETAIKALKPRNKSYKATDEKGLYLLVTPSGGRLWKLKFRTLAGLEKKLSLGSYPDVSLKDARDSRDQARRVLASGTDPAEKKRRDKHAAKIGAANSFSAVAEAYIKKNRRDGLAEATIVKREWFLKLVERSLGHRPIAEIAPFEVLEAVRPFEAAKNNEKAHRTLQFIGQVFRYAVANQLAPSNPTRDLRGALANSRPKHLAAILDPKQAGELLRAIDGYEGHPVTRIALKLSALVFVRPGELRQAEWSEIDFEAAIWRIPAGKMKKRIEHVVPLSKQSVALFRDAQAITGGGRYVFPSMRTPLRPMSENTVNGALRRLGFTGDEMTAHGFRAMASTLLNESLKWSSDAIERALAHKDKDTIRAAYHRGTHWAERVEMAQWWADHLEVLRRGAEVVQLKPGRAKA